MASRVPPDMRPFPARSAAAGRPTPAPSPATPLYRPIPLAHFQPTPPPPRPPYQPPAPPTHSHPHSHPPPPARPPASRLVPRAQFNTPIPRPSKQLSFSPSLSPHGIGGAGGGVHPLSITSPSFASADSSRVAAVLVDGEKDKRRRSTLPVFATAAAVASLLLLLLLAGLYLPPGAPFIVMPHPPTLAVLRDARLAQLPPAVSAASAAAAGGSSVHRLQQRISSPQQQDSANTTLLQPRQQSDLIEHHAPVLTVTARLSDTAPLPPLPPPAKQQPATASAATATHAPSSPLSVLSSRPLALASYYQRNLSSPAIFHTGFFNEPYMRDRSTPLSDRSLLASNRALPHSFPAPLSFAPALLSSSVVVGVFCYNVARIEVLLDTWGKWLLPAHLLIFSEPSSDPAAQLRQQSLPSVIIMDNDANKHRNVTDRRASAWKILPAVRLMHQRHPHSPWYYLCDDDSFPLVPNLAHFTANFYSAAHGPYTPQHAMYVGESVMQQTFYKGYYADEKGLQVDLRYHCTGGGVLLNQRLMSLLEPHVDRCFTFFASDLSLGHCIQQHVPNVSMIEIPDGTHMFSRTMEEVVDKFGQREAVVWAAGAFHHMREPFIAKWGVDTRLEVYLRESEMRGFASYLWTLAEMEREAERDSRAGRDVSVRGVAVAAAVAGQSQRKLRVLLAMRRDSDEALNDVAAVVAAMLARDGWQPLSFLSPLHLDTDVLLLGAVELTACSHCDVYGESRDRCMQLFADKDATLVSHIQTTQPSASVRQLRLQDMTYAEYDLVLSMDAILSPSDAAQALYVHATHPPCSFAGPSPPAPYSFALIDELSLLDELSSVSSLSSSHQPSLLQFPSLSLYYGVYHSLGLSSQPNLHADRPATLRVAGSEAEKAVYAAAVVGTSHLSLTMAPVQPLQLSHLRELSVARLCVFAPDLASSNRSNMPVSSERRVVAHLAVAAIASGCLTVVSAEVAGWGLKGERLDEAAQSAAGDGRGGGAAAGIGVLLGGATVVADLAALRSFVGRVSSPGSREYGVELAYQRTALNSHMMEKPWHTVLTTLKQHRDRLQSVGQAGAVTKQKSI